MFPGVTNDDQAAILKPMLCVYAQDLAPSAGINEDVPGQFILPKIN